MWVIYLLVGDFLKLVNDVKFYERFIELFLNLPKGSLKNKVQILKYEKDNIVLLVDKKEIVVSIK